MGKLAYWTCKIGPANRDKLPEWADRPLRNAIAHAFVETTGQEAYTISSGWGRKENDEGYLGLATTRQLLEELRERGARSAAAGEYPREMGDMAIGAANLLNGGLPGSMLDYRTVDHS